MEDEVRSFIHAGNRQLAAKAYGPACVEYSRALDLQPGLAAAHYNIGAIFLMAGRPEDGIPALLTAAELQPANAQFAIALARALLDSGDRHRAASLLDATQRRMPADASVAEAARQLPLDPSASASYEGVRDQVDPADAADRLAQAVMAADKGDTDTAFHTVKSLVWSLPGSTELWCLLARLAPERVSGEYAELCARRAVALAPDNPAGWVSLTRCLRRSGSRDGDAERALMTATRRCGHGPALSDARIELLLAANRFESAAAFLDQLKAETDGAEADILRLRARVHEAAGEYTQAARCFDDAIAIAPERADLVLAAAEFHDKQVDPAGMLNVIEKGRANGLDFQSGELLDAHARASLKAGRLDEARESVIAAIAAGGQPNQLRSRDFTLGRIEDRRGAHRDAFTAFMAGNSQLEAIWEDNGPCDHTMPLRRLQSLLGRLEKEIAEGGSVPASPDDPGRPPAQTVRLAFLVGFPRSGTTLLDTILRSHSGTEIVEERPVLIDALRSAEPGIAGDETNFTEDWLDRIHAAPPETLRDHYLARLEEEIGDSLSNKITYIDKLPLNMNWAPLIHRIFPDAVFILARRHPFDVAISNLFQDFSPNNAMMNMTRLERIDALFDLSFTLWERFAAWRQPRIAEVRYESLVSDLENTVAPVMGALGLEWEAAQSRFFETARQRGRINTPSAQQVIRPLYSTSRERWRNYAFAFEGDDTARLRSWAGRAGYSTSAGE